MLKTVSTANGLVSPTFSGDVTLSNGNLVIGTAGKGIDFSADPSAAGMTSELLDDYEEGTWTPVYVSSGATFTYAVQAGWYRKVGSLVTVGFTLEASTAGTVTNGLSISGLPFTSQNTANTYGTVATGYTTFTELALGQLPSNSSAIAAYRSNSTGASATPATAGMDSSARYWIGVMSYMSAS